MRHVNAFNRVMSDTWASMSRLSAHNNECNNAQSVPARLIHEDMSAAPWDEQRIGTLTWMIAPEPNEMAYGFGLNP